jgi:hypothetical protein
MHKCPSCNLDCDCDRGLPGCEHLCDATWDNPTWELAIQEAAERARQLKRREYRLRVAIRIMKKFIRDGVPWPTDRNRELAERDK